jgi:hypothetical protein
LASSIGTQLIERQFVTSSDYGFELGERRLRPLLKIGDFAEQGFDVIGRASLRR